MTSEKKKGGGGSGGEGRLVFCVFASVLRSLITAAKSTAKGKKTKLSRGGEEGGEGEERGESSSPAEGVEGKRTGGPGRASEQQLTHLTPQTPVCLAEMQIHRRGREWEGEKSGRRAAINSSVFA